MCASCGCGCKPGKAAKGCKCSCKTCREARMSVEKSFMVAKAYRDLEEFAKSFELAPTHVGSISAGQRYCDNDSCATCIKQKSRDENVKQTASHVRKDDDVEKGMSSEGVRSAYYGAKDAMREAKYKAGDSLREAKYKTGDSLRETRLKAGDKLRRSK